MDSDPFLRKFVLESFWSIFHCWAFRHDVDRTLDATSFRAHTDKRKKTQRIKGLYIRKLDIRKPRAVVRPHLVTVVRLSYAIRRIARRAVIGTDQLYGSRGKMGLKGMLEGLQRRKGQSDWLRRPRSIVAEKASRVRRANAIHYRRPIHVDFPTGPDDGGLRTRFQRSGQRIRLEASDRIKLRWWPTMEPIVVRWENVGDGGGVRRRRLTIVCLSNRFVVRFMLLSVYSYCSPSFMYTDTVVISVQRIVQTDGRTDDLR